MNGTKSYAWCYALCARYVGPAGKGALSLVWFGLVRVGLGWDSGWGSADCARILVTHESPDPLNY